MTMSDSSTVHTLGDRGQTVDGSANDVRGREVKDSNGDGIGKVVDLLVDDQENKVRFLLVEHGGFLGFGEKQSLIPVDAITKTTKDEVFIDQSRDRVAAAPGYDPGLLEARPYHASIYHHYGFPVLGPGLRRLGPARSPPGSGGRPEPQRRYQAPTGLSFRKRNRRPDPPQECFQCCSSSSMC